MSDEAYKSAAGIYGKKGALVRLVYLAGAAAAWAVTLGGRLGCRHAVVLCYHGVTDAQKARFAKQMQRIGSRGVPVSDVERNAASMAKPAVCVTFDDAFASLLRQTLGDAQAAGVPTAVFAVSGNMGRTPAWEMAPGHPERTEMIMMADELRDASKLPGCTIGSHTVHHKPLGRIPRAEAAEQLRVSKAELESMLGREVRDFAAPYGSWTPEVAADAWAMGYKRFLTLDPCDTGTQQGVVGRYLMSPDVWPLEFALTACGAYRWVFKLRRLAKSLRRKPATPARTGTTTVVESHA